MNVETDKKKKTHKHLATLLPVGKLPWINVAATAQIPSSCFFLCLRTQAGNCFDRISHPECRKHLSL